MAKETSPAAPPDGPDVAAGEPLTERPGALGPGLGASQGRRPGGGRAVDPGAGAGVGVGAGGGERAGASASVAGRDGNEGAASLRTVLIALGANVAIAAAKLSAGLVTGSSAMLSEAWHAVADSGNEAVLVVARRRSTRPPDERHPLGHGREAYFWALIAAVGVFVAGGLLSLQQGYRELTEPEPASNFGVAYAVLVVSLALESVSFLQASRELQREASELRRGFFQHVRLSSEPTTRAVFAEDSAAVIGNLVALAGIGLHQLTGSSLPDGIASLLIGLLLGYVGVRLAARNRDFLVGEAAPRGLQDRCRALVRSQPGVAAVTDLLMIFTGPRQLLVVAHVELEPGLGAAQVAASLGAPRRPSGRSCPRWCGPRSSRWRRRRRCHRCRRWSTGRGPRPGE